MYYKVCCCLHAPNQIVKSVLVSLIKLRNLLMAEQAQSDAGDLDGLQDVPQDAPQDPTDPPTKKPYTRLMKELNEPDPPPQG